MPKALKSPIIRIESDGLGYNTKVTHVESGTELSPCIRGIKWAIDANGLAVVSLELCGAYVQVDLTGELAELSRQFVGREVEQTDGG